MVTTERGLYLGHTLSPTGFLYKDILFLLFIYLFLFIFIFLVFLPFLGPLPWHMEVPRLRVELEL